MKFIFKILKFIFTLFIAFIIFTYFFSLKSNMSFNDTVGYFKVVIGEILRTNNSENIATNSDLNSEDFEITTSSNKYYYGSQLDDTAKIIYNKFSKNIDNLKKDNYVIDFSTTFNELLNTTTGQYKLNKAFQSALDAFFYDHPELFYIDITKMSLDIKCMSIASLKTYTVEISPKGGNYLLSSFNSEEEVISAINKVESIKNNIINSVAEYNTYNKIKTIHNLWVSSIEYNETINNSNNYNIYGALVENKVVCEGYAKAFKYLMDSLDIECILVSGTATYIYDYGSEGGPHMWNYVKLNDSWYGVDVTWDDPIGYNSSKIKQDFFLKGYYTFVDSHIPDGKITDKGMLFTLPTLSTENFR